MGVGVWECLQTFRAENCEGKGLGDLGVKRSAVLVDGKEMGLEGADWIHCFQEQVHFKFCEMGMNLWVSQNAGEISWQAE